MEKAKGKKHPEKGRILKGKKQQKRENRAKSCRIFKPRFYCFLILCPASPE
jgi:hypothetical protein